MFGWAMQICHDFLGLCSGGASSEKSERNGGDFDVIFQSKGIPN